MITISNKHLYYFIFFVLFSMTSCKTKKSKSNERAINNIDSLSIGIAVTTRHLMKLAEPVFTAANPELNVSSYIHETGNVVDDVIMDKTTIAITTRNLKVYEKEKSATILATPIGLDGLVLAVSNSIPITTLSFEQIVGIWTQKYVNWNELGGPDLAIVVIGRTKKYDPINLFGDFMKLDSKVVDGGIIYSEKGIENWSKIVSEATETDDLALKKMVETPGSITYFPLQILNNYMAEGFAINEIAFNGIKATYETIENGDYFIHRRLNVITNGKPKDAAKSFIDFILSEKGQQLVENAGFLKLKQ